MDLRDRLSHESEWLHRLARELVRDAHLAEDLSQDALAAALSRPPREDNLRGWLRVVLRRLVQARRRREGQRAERERRASQVEAQPSTADSVERRVAQEAVAHVVLELEEPLRSTLLLRYWSNLSVAQIAEQSGVSQEAIRLRIRRGHERLRAELPRDVAPALVWWAEFGGDASRAAPGGARVPLPKRWVRAAGLIAVVAATVGLFWIWAERGTTPEQERARGPEVVERVGSPADESSTDRTPIRSRDDDRAQRVEFGAPDLIVRVVDPDGEPAVGVHVAVRPGEDASWLRETRVPTDAEGIARFARAALPPADEWAVRTDRGGQLAKMGSRDPAPLTLNLPVGSTVTGLVLGPDGRPQAGASLWYVPPGFGSDEGAPVGRTDDDGAFVLHHLPAGGTLAAIAEGLGSTRSVLVKSGAGGSGLQLKCWPRLLAIRGVVRDPWGNAVPDASVLVGWVVPEDDIMAPSRLRTSRDGRFACAEQGHIETPVWVRAPGFAVQRVVVPEEDRPAVELDLRLSPGGSLSGRVTDVEGEPIANVRIEVRQQQVEPPPGMGWDGPGWGRLHTRTDADGGYSVEAVAPGEVRVTAVADNGSEASAALAIEEGDLTHWDPTLGPVGPLVVTVVDSERRPLAGWPVSASQVGDDRGKRAVTGADGIAELSACVEGARYSVAVAQSGALPAGHGWREHLVFRRGTPCEIVVPVGGIGSAMLTFELRGPTGAPLTSVRFALVGSVDDRVGMIDHRDAGAADGHYRLGPVLPGSYELLVAAPGLGQRASGSFAIGVDDLDLGRIDFEQPARVEVRVRRPDGAPAHAEEAWLYGRGCRVGLSVPLGARGGWVVAQPGHYQLCYRGEDGALGAVGFDAVAARDREVVLNLEPGVRRQFRYVGVDPSRNKLWFHWSRDGREVYREFNRVKPAEDFPLDFVVAPGAYRVTVRDIAGWTASSEFVVTEEPESSVVYELSCAVKPPSGDAQSSSSPRSSSSVIPSPKLRPR